MALEARTLVERALAAVRVEVPVAAGQMGRALGHRRLLLRCGAEEMVVDAVTGGLEVRQPGGDFDLELEAPLRFVVDLVDGRDDLLEAVLADRVRVRGSPGDITALHGALVSFVQGAIRSRSCHELMVRARMAVRPEENAR